MQTRTPSISIFTIRFNKCFIKPKKSWRLCRKVDFVFNQEINCKLLLNMCFSVDPPIRVSTGWRWDVFERMVYIVDGGQEVRQQTLM